MENTADQVRSNILSPENNQGKLDFLNGSQRHSLLRVCLSLVTPVTLVTTVVHYGQGNLLAVALDLAIIVYLWSGLLWIREREQASRFFSVGAALASGVIVLHLLLAGHAPGLLYFTYLVPLLGFTLLGQRQALSWTLFLLAVLAIVLLRDDALARLYGDNPTRLRFLASFVLVSALAMALEHFRQTVFRRLQERIHAVEREHRRLQSALTEIRELKEMLSSCAWCRRVRDEAGEWQILEAYIQRNSRTKFTHGICPDCLAEVKTVEVDLAGTGDE